MSKEYVTAEEQLADAGEGETVLQIRDAETKEIFRTRARIAREPERLADPAPLRVVGGPHETSEEQWYVELLPADDVDEGRLRRLADDQQDASNVVNTRSDDLKVLLRYLVETGQYESTAAATRALAFEGLAASRPSLLEIYDDVRTEFEADPLRDALEDD
jgi:hypothetical protein